MAFGSPRNSALYESDSERKHLQFRHTILRPAAILHPFACGLDRCTDLTTCSSNAPSDLQGRVGVQRTAHQRYYFKSESWQRGKIQMHSLNSFVSNREMIRVRRPGAGAPVVHRRGSVLALLNPWAAINLQMRTHCTHSSALRRVHAHPRTHSPPPSFWTCEPRLRITHTKSSSPWPPVTWCVGLTGEAGALELFHHLFYY